MTQDMNHALTQEFTDDVVKRPLVDIWDLKAPGVDDMPALFYKRYKNVVEQDVIKKVPTGWNEMLVVSIPKVPHLERIKDL